jgi:diguanylate cyclase (GGDEF)-like protein/PAS domain S-box-containing protein
MENTGSVVLLALAGILFIGAGVLIFRSLRWIVHRRQWVLLGVAFIILTLLAGLILYQQTIIVQSNALGLIIGVLMVIAAGLACTGLYLLGNQFISEAQSKTTTQQALERYRLSFENEPHLLVIKDTQGTYLAANSAYAQLLGKSSQELIGESDFNFFPRSQAVLFRQKEENVIKSGKVQSHEEEIRGIDGIRWLRLTRIPLKDSFNSIVGVLTSGYDITTQKQEEAALTEWERGVVILREAEKAFEECKNIESIYESIIGWAGKLGESDHGGLWFVIPEKSYAILKAGSGKIKPFVDTQIRPGKDIAWKVWESGQPLIVKDYINWPDRGHWSSESGLHSGIGLPMKVNEVATTVLTLFHDEPGVTFQDERVTLLGMFAQIASSRLNNIKNLDSLKSNLEDRQVLHARLQFRAGLDHALAVIATQFITLEPQKIDQGIQQALVTIAEKMGVESCYLSLFPRSEYSKMDQPLEYNSESAEPLEVKRDFTQQSFGWCLDRLNQFEVVYIPSLANLAEDQQAKAFLQSEAIQSFIAVPLISNRLVFGFFGFEARKAEKEWSSEILTLLRVGAEIFVNVLQRKWAAHEAHVTRDETKHQIQILKQRNHESGLIAEMGDLLQACRTADEAYPIITRYVQDLIPIGSGALYMIQHAQDPAERVAAWGNATQSPLEQELLPNECWALRRGRIYVVQDPLTDPICAHVKDPGDSGYMCVPLIAQGVAIGILHLRQNHAKKGFSQDSQHLAVKIGEFTSMSLTNLKLRDELRSQAIRDPLTGLFNRRYMEETLKREVRRAHRHSTAVGVIMFDIDKMKPINDKLGHDAGDLVLRTLGEELLRLFRSEDVACRYGGDEFTIVLPEASLADAWQRAEQLRDAVKGLEMQYEGKRLGPITLAIGVAAYPDHGSSAESLLLVSDAASYAAKSEGGDRIMVGHRDET